MTGFSRLVFSRFHREPFLPEAAEWGFSGNRPLSAANAALAWIVFCRDRGVFEREFPEWTPARVTPDMPFCYIASGGLSFRGLFPRASFKWFRRAEKLLSPFMEALAMFAVIKLERR